MYTVETKRFKNDTGVEEYLNACEANGYVVITAQYIGYSDHDWLTPYTWKFVTKQKPLEHHPV